MQNRLFEELSNTIDGMNNLKDWAKVMLPVTVGIYTFEPTKMEHIKVDRIYKVLLKIVLFNRVINKTGYFGKNKNEVMTVLDDLFNQNETRFLGEIRIRLEKIKKKLF